MRITDSRQLRVEHVMNGQTPSVFHLFEPVSNESRTATIFVHGFRADTLSTWGLAEDKYFWPIEIGIETNTSVYCIEYLNQLQSRAPRAPLPVRNVNEVIVEQLRPILQAHDRVVLITHSFGGVLAKDLFSFIANNADPGISHLAFKLRGIYFLSCPHRGHYMAYTLKYLLRALISKNLKTMGSRHIAAINTDFLRDYDRRPGGLLLKTLGECGYLYFVFRVGPKASQLRSDIPHTDDEKNHSTICKSLAKTDPVFTQVLAFVNLVRRQVALDQRRLRAPLGE